MTLKRILLLIPIIVLILAACGANDSEGESSEETPEGTLTVYAGMPEEHAIAAIDKFEEETGITVNMVRMSGGEILARIRAEQNNPQADIWYGGPADTFEAAKDEGLLKAYHSPVAEDIPEQYKDPDGYWTGVYTGAVAFITSKDFLETNNLEPPTSWEDLLEPEYTNEVVLANPISSGGAYTAVYGIISTMGSEDAGFEYFKKLDEQIQQYPTSGSATTRMVGLNEVGAAIQFAHDVPGYQKEGFDNLVLSFPEEGTGYEVAAVAMIEGTQNSELAEQFIDWASGPSGQEVGQTVDSFQSLTHPDAKQPEEAPDLESVNIMDYTPGEAGEARQEILDRWDREIVE